MRSTKFKFSANDIHLRLDRLDQLIENYLCTLIENSDKVKLPDFVRLVELRVMITPDKDSSGQINQRIDTAREQELSKLTADSPGEEPSE